MATSTRLTRLWHSVRPGRDSVARPSDRVQAGLLLAVILLSLAAVAAAVLLGIGIHGRDAARSHEQLATRYAATAVLQGPAVGIPGEPGPARATWMTRDGRWRTGEVAAPAGTVAGDEVPIWLDATGNPAERPLTPVAAVVDATVVPVGLWAGVVFLLALSYSGVVALLDRFRFAQWQREWSARQTGRTRRDDQSQAGSG